MKKFTIFILLLCANRIFAQSAFQVTESDPVNVGGLTMGYSIKSEEEKEVGSKGNFSRFSVKFFVTNSTQESKILLYKEGFNPMGNVSDQLAQFNCLNATGARLTSKSAVLSAPACNVMAIVDDKDPSGKDIKNKRFVQIGYWIKAGQTISANAIVIVPLNQKPNVEVVYLANSLQPVASVAGYTGNNGGNGGGGYNNNNGNNNGGYNNGNQNIPPPPPPQRNQFPEGYVKIRNVGTNNYLNTEGGSFSCTPIKNDWWSAQWTITPVTVNGQNYYTIQNRWKTSFLSIENSSLLSPNNQAGMSMWLMESMDGGQTFTIKNATRNASVSDQHGVQIVPMEGRNPSFKWVIEQ